MADLNAQSLLLYINPGEDLKDAKRCPLGDLQTLIDTNDTYELSGFVQNAAGDWEVVLTGTDIDGNVTTTTAAFTPTPPETDEVDIDGSVAPVWDAPTSSFIWTTATDVAGTPGTLSQDMSALVALLTSVTPTSPNGSITIVGDAQTGYTIETEDEDTRCTFALVDGQIEKTAQLYVNGAPSGDPVVSQIPLPCPVLDCEGPNGMRFLDGKGGSRDFTVGYRRRTLSVGVNNFDETLPPGLWAATEDCTNLTIGPCEQGVRVEDIYSTVARTVGAIGGLSTTTWISLDGGATYSQMATNGLDQSYWSSRDDTGERTFVKEDIYQLAPGTYNICRITEIISNTLDAGSSLQLPNKNTYIWYMDTRCC